MATNPSVDADHYIITLPEAKKRIAQWQADQSELIAKMAGTPLHIYEDLPMLQVKAFTFEFSEMADLIDKIKTYNETADVKIDGLRFYLGVNDEVGEATVPQACLVAVGVSNFDPEMSMGGDDVLCVDTDTDSPSIIYDFSYPCPSTCGNAGHTIMDYTSQPCVPD